MKMKMTVMMMVEGEGEVGPWELVRYQGWRLRRFMSALSNCVKNLRILGCFIGAPGGKVLFTQWRMLSDVTAGSLRAYEDSSWAELLLKRPKKSLLGIMG